MCMLWLLNEQNKTSIYDMKSILILLPTMFLFGCIGSNGKLENSDTKIEIQEKNCVDRVLEQDSILGHLRNQASKNISLSETIDYYANGLKSMDYTHCPENFKSAFQAHCEAWLEIKKVSDRYPSLRGELHDVFGQLEKSEDSTEFKLLVKQIWDTWKVVGESSE